MNKAEFIEKFSEKTGYSKRESTVAVNAVLVCASDAIVKDGSLTFVGFGSFKIAKRAARNGINPQTHEKTKFPAHKVVKFKAGKDLKEAAAKSKAVK